MELLFEAASILETHKYAITRISKRQDELEFEDESLLGLVWAAPTVATLLEAWRTRQNEFLRRSASRLRAAENKGWNVYLVLLSPDKASAIEKNSLLNIEEDFRSARKIAQADIATPSQLRRALYPFLPIQNVVSMEQANAVDRFKGRLSSVPAIAINSLFSQEAAEVGARRFLSVYENQQD